MGDADSVDQWNQSTTGQYSDFEWDGTSFNDPMSNSRLQPSRVMGHLGENPGVISNWPQPSDHLDYDTARLVGLCAFDQAQQKTRECWPSGSQRLGNESCVSDFTPSLSSVEQSFDADRYQFEMGQGCLEAVTSLDDIESLQQNLMHVTGAHQSESLAPPKLIQDVSQGSSNLWGLNLSTTEFCTPSSTHHTPEFEVPNSRPKEHERTQVISITARESFFDPLSAATENINQDIQSLGLNSPCSLGFSRTSDTSDIQQDPDLSASNLESPNMPIHPLHGLPNNESRLKFGSASSSLSNDSVRQTDQRVPQVPRGWVIEETNGLKPSPHSGIRESFIDPAQQRASIIRPCISETNGKQTDGNNTRKAPRPRNTFQIVREDGGGGPTSGLPQATPTCRARRQGPLSADGRRNAALRRKDRSVCIWCRLSKKKCSGDTPCVACIEQAKSIIIEQPCVKADFFQVIESGTCNYISQRAVNHLTLDGSSRRRMELPSTFKMHHFVSLLEKRQGRFNIRVRQAWGTLFVLDLKQACDYLKSAEEKQQSAQYDLRDFIDNYVLKLNDWQRCVKECNPVQDALSLLSQWNNMPSRASYDFVSQPDGMPDRPMNIEDPNDQSEILLAAQLSRIFCRKLEVDGYRALQCALNKNKWDDMPYESFLKFLSQLGNILVSLRWRVSWWELLGDGGSKPDINKERYEERVWTLCKVLYFYYTSVKLKLPSWMKHDGLDGVWSMYADADQVWDDFPLMGTAEGFEVWMARGKELIREAGVRSHVPNI